MGPQAQDGCLSVLGLERRAPRGRGHRQVFGKVVSHRPPMMK